MSVLIVTSIGDMVIDLHTDQCPLTTKNFLKLCKIKYFNGCLFHSIQKDFIAQTGDPTGKGTGGSSIYKFLYGDQARFFGDEIHQDLKHSKIGTVAMASAGENLNASQFYFTLRDGLDYLNGKHTVFGQVAEGLDILEKINEAFVDENERPLKNIRIKHTHILDDPFDDPPQLADLIPDASPQGKPKDEIDDDVRLEDDWVPMDEKFGSSEMDEIVRDKEAHSSAVVLETLGDIPEAGITPPENVLFVCKLNPVTEDDDLNTIFSRFGDVVSAEVIRDYKTGDSLGYAFIEFGSKEACEQAFFKMDNALIDDRRIHVDFSQSVSKLWSQYRRKDKQPDKGRGHPLNEKMVQMIAGNRHSRYEMVFDGSEQRKRSHEFESKEKREKRRRDKPSVEEMKPRSRGINRDQHYHGNYRKSERYSKSETTRGRREDAGYKIADREDRIKDKRSGSREDRDLRSTHPRGDERREHISKKRRVDSNRDDPRYGAENLR
ncbi:peptidylprolyl isomerase [Ranunculus cassubicifolius]